LRSLLIAPLLALIVGSTAFAAEVHISVAASMTEATKELIATYEKQIEGVSFLPNFGSSGALAKQIVLGAPADIFISANPEWMDYLVKKKFVPAEKVRIFAYNSLVFLGKKGLAVTTLGDIAGLRRIAIGSPKSVPAGQYAKRALIKAGLYKQLKGKLVMAKDVRQALAYADQGESDGAFVYRTDALLAKNSTILLEVPQKLYGKVIYPVGLTAEGAGKPEAVAFFSFLKTDEATRIPKKYGFTVPGL
jgi:molybdate transport system substrate-binding protein